VRKRSCIPAWLALATALAAPGARAEQGKPLIVVIDPGHGGSNPRSGARGTRGLLEKNIVLEVSRRLKATLEAAGATAILTREDDVDLPLSARAVIANEADADVFLSIHCNSMATAEDRQVTQGIETYFLSPDPTDAEARLLAEIENGGPAALPVPQSADPVRGLLADLQLGQARNDSAQLAQLVQRTLVRALRATGRGVRQAPFLVLSALKMPAVLVEIGFISHPREGRRLATADYQQRVADGLAAAVHQFADGVLARRLNEAPERAAPAAQPRPAPKAAAPAKAVEGAAASPGPAAAPTVAGLPATR
jgi:N-acetylmuramoyl-L-alanine amidase